MRRSMLVLLGVCVLGPVAGRAQAPAPAPAGDIAVTVSYTTKAAKVDDTHEIWVFLFDHPNVARGSRPLGTEIVRKNGGTAVFKGVSTQSPVYVLALYDLTGTYDGNAGPPPPGTPMGMYSADRKAPTAVKPGAKIKMSFNDARKFGQ
jgi:hypothetical protein